MKKSLHQRNRNGAIAMSQIGILLIAIFAFAWTAGSFDIVSASDQTGNTPPSASTPTSIELEMEKYLLEEETEILPEDEFVFNPDSSPVAPDFVPKNSWYKKAVPMIVKSAKIAAVAYGTYKLAGWIARQTKAGADTTNLLKSLGAGGGTWLGLALFGNPLAGLGLSNPLTAGLVFLATAVLSEETVESGVVYYYCNAWDAPTGGTNCDRCNNQEVPCSEYQCKTLGQSCEFVASDEQNDGESFCFWNNRNDIDPPVVSPNDDALSKSYTYNPSTAISPPDIGIKIRSASDDGCLSPYSTITFGVTTNEPAKCKIDFQNKNSYEDMATYFGGSSTRKYNHTQTLLIPEISSALGKDNIIMAYVRCQDSNGNSNIHNFVFEMCVQEGPDTTPPVIKGTSITNGAKIPFGRTNASVDVYVNEPAECKWAFSDKTYDEMDYNMTCATEATRLNLLLSYTCVANLTGIRTEEKTNYYFRCRDNPELEELSDRNTNAESYKYALEGSRALSIVEATPNNTEVSDLTSPATVELAAKTIGGTKDGKSTCLYSASGEDGTYEFFESTDSTSHSTKLYLASGNHDYYVQCYDEAGNAAVEKVNFSVYVDEQEPLISRAYYDEGKLKIVTNENAECVYSTFSCNYAFDDGVATNSYDELNHYMSWNPETDLYVKCQDVYGNRPAVANECSIVLRAQK